MIVLLHHGFDPVRRSPADDPHSLFATPAALESQLRLLHRIGWRPTDLDGWLATGGRGRRYLVTFDDGYRSVLDHAVPILRRFGAPAVLFVPPGIVGRDEAPERILDAAELREVMAAGVELGVHGFDHTPLAGLREEDLVRQTETARDVLAELTGVVPRAFAFPNGSFDDAAVSAVRRAGFLVGFSVDRDGGPFAVPRLALYARDTTASFLAKALLSPRALSPLLRKVRRWRG